MENNKLNEEQKAELNKKIRLYEFAARACLLTSIAATLSALWVLASSVIA